MLSSLSVVVVLLAIFGCCLAEKEVSGRKWCEKFPGENTLDALNDAKFQNGMKRFTKALRKAGAKYSINSVYRPKERQYNMYYCWNICNKHWDASKIPEYENVEIEWWHGDQGLSENAACEMVECFGMKNLLTSPAEPPQFGNKGSMHQQRLAVDMAVSWKDDLLIELAEGGWQLISSEPRNSLNRDLIEVAAGYGVIHYKKEPISKDAIHWSSDGR